ncbi:hypothetical protein AT727_24040 [Desulfitobacterium hafniense]|uniref:Rhodanese domain-containing protein n=1 Tax=Desulfitobacterium hafniense TaxID=49338 RepID=A0A0W1JGZ3_DESHA|nr:rhodanese-like domain-containing protein [Desulfitobacterium hafniense]KTE90738.1 hypothetical protein AT727_24040 [Desulfitobacterium hafniense]
MQLVKKVEGFFNNIPKGKFGIDMMEFDDLMSNNQYFLLDIREKKEFLKFRFKGSENIPFMQVGYRLDEIPFDKKIILICNTGFTAAQTSSLLNILGYQTWILRDGILGYIEMGGQVERGPIK